jgi:hypothetical protein
LRGRYEQKRNLCASFDLFLADDRIVRLSQMLSILISSDTTIFVDRHLGSNASSPHWLCIFSKKKAADCHRCLCPKQIPLLFITIDVFASLDPMYFDFLRPFMFLSSAPRKTSSCKSSAPRNARCSMLLLVAAACCVLEILHSLSKKMRKTWRRPSNK